MVWFLFSLSVVLSIVLISTSLGMGLNSRVISGPHDPHDFWFFWAEVGILACISLALIWAAIDGVGTSGIARTVVAIASLFPVAVGAWQLTIDTPTADEIAYSNARYSFDQTRSCVADRVNTSHATDTLSDFAASLGAEDKDARLPICVNVATFLGKTPTEIQSVRPSGSGTYLLSADQSGVPSGLTFVTIGKGGILYWNASGANRTYLFCWRVEVDLDGREVGEPVDANCDSISGLWHPDKIVSIAELE